MLFVREEKFYFAFTAIELLRNFKLYLDQTSLGAGIPVLLSVICFELLVRTEMAAVPFGVTGSAGVVLQRSSGAPVREGARFKAARSQAAVASCFAQVHLAISKNQVSGNRTGDDRVLLGPPCV